MRARLDASAVFQVTPTNHNPPLVFVPQGAMISTEDQAGVILKYLEANGYLTAPKEGEQQEAAAAQA